MAGYPVASRVTSLSSQHPPAGSHHSRQRRESSGSGNFVGSTQLQLAAQRSAGSSTLLPSKWRFEVLFSSNAKMFFASPLAALIVGLVGYILSMVALLLTAALPSAIISMAISGPERYADGRRGSRGSERWRQAINEQGSPLEDVASAEERYHDDSISAGSAASGRHNTESRSSSPFKLEPSHDFATPTRVSYEGDDRDATPKVTSRPQSYERTMTAPPYMLHHLIERDDAGPSTIATRPPITQRTSSLRRSFKGFKDAMRLGTKRRSSDMDVNFPTRNTAASSPFATENEGIGEAELHISRPLPSPTESAPSICSSQSPSESSYSSSLSNGPNKLRKPFIQRLGRSASHKLPSPSSSPLRPSSSNKHQKTKPPPLRTTYTYTFLPTSEDPYEEDEGEEQIERDSWSIPSAHASENSNSYPTSPPRPSRSTSLPRRNTPHHPSHERRLTSDPIPIFTPLSPSTVPPALITVATSRQEALLALEGKRCADKQARDFSAVGSIGVALGTPTSVMTQAKVKGENERPTSANSTTKGSRGASRFKFLRGSWSSSPPRSPGVAVSPVTGGNVTDDDEDDINPDRANSGVSGGVSLMAVVGQDVNVDEFGVVRSPKRSSVSEVREVGNREGVSEGVIVEGAEHNSRKRTFFRLIPGSGSKPPVSGSRRSRSWKRFSFS
ncbi:uncharacterized protein EI90DRAFT_3152397 [Cantharellus anzutake]|uniref:uncharacterized protein n=1 Tax=Cantharellus anzutake TaxID=1750568 RepID=UPI001904DDA9|nr:uncharacterized protein EI90DRAFT_3152397 [Cantharellus anzutake]KAF8336987.1 hypothetical protein EI90DRAFT_3152397 [Cantharellus anzutake]